MAQSGASDDIFTHCENVVSSHINKSKYQDVDEAVDVFTEPIRTSYLEKSVSPEDLGLWEVWRAVVDVAKRTDGDSPATERLVKFLAMLKTRTITDQSTNKPATHKDGGTLWHDLPVFGYATRKAWNAAPPQMSAVEWRNLNTFAARVTAASVHDFSLYAVWALRDALETEKLLTQRDADGVEAQDGPGGQVPLESLLPAAVAWIEYCGAELAAMAKHGHGYTEGRPENSPDPSWLGKLAKDDGVDGTGWTNARWRFWMKRLEEIAGAKDEQGGREKVAKIAFQGLEKMKGLDA